MQSFPSSSVPHGAPTALVFDVLSLIRHKTIRLSNLPPALYPAVAICLGERLAEVRDTLHDTFGRPVAVRPLSEWLELVAFQSSHKLSGFPVPSLSITQGGEAALVAWEAARAASNACATSAYGAVGAEGGAKAESTVDAQIREGPPLTSEVIEALLSREGRAILHIAEGADSADAKMSQIYKLDNRVLEWDSPQWAALLRTTPSAIRQTNFWQNDRPKLRGG
jgi:hypothetical protein